jgi:hypothetical protein
MGLYPALLITLQYPKTCKPNKALNSLYVVASIQNVDITDLFEEVCIGDLYRPNFLGTYFWGRPCSFCQSLVNFSSCVSSLRTQASSSSFGSLCSCRTWSTASAKTFLVFVMSASSMASLRPASTSNP